MGAFMKFGNEPTVIQASMEVQMFTQQKCAHTLYTMSCLSIA